MREKIFECVENHLWVYQPKEGKCVSYSSESVRAIADELGLGYDAANEIVRNYIQDKF